MRRGGRDLPAGLWLESFAEVMFAPPRNAPAVVKYLVQSCEAEPESEHLQLDRIMRIVP
jgi:hypothetical protein